MMNTPVSSPGARRLSEVSAQRRAELNAGAVTKNLMEQLSIDFAVLIQNTLPQASDTTIATLQAAATTGIIGRMAVAGKALYAQLGPKSVALLANHPTDTVRAWACYVLTQLPSLTLAERLDRVRPLADDAHFAVREYAWLALRPLLMAELEQAIALLAPWTDEPSPNLRRFASEALRPRGVWCKHIPALKTNPEMALPLLEPLRADQSTYVQDSVANWLNDASKTQADWVRLLCQRWLSGEPNRATERICRRALRSVGK